MTHYVYIIESINTHQWYYGYTQRPEERLKEHNGNHHHYTANKGPWKLIFLRCFNEKKDSMDFEKKLKATRNKEYIMRAYKSYFLNE